MATKKHTVLVAVAMVLAATAAAVAVAEEFGEAQTPEGVGSSAVELAVILRTCQAYLRRLLPPPPVAEVS